MSKPYFIGPYFVREWGNPNGKPLLLIHGNAVHSEIWEWISNRIPIQYRVIAPDLRGYGKTSIELKISAENGVFDWVNDINQIVNELKLTEVEVWGHSLGGNVLWGILSENPDWLKKAVFISTGSPYGFGKLNVADGSGTGAGFVHPEFLEYLKNKDLGDGRKLTQPISVYSKLFYQKPEFQTIEKLAQMGFEMDLSENGYPGDWKASEFWPFRKPGKWGGVNALSPPYQKKLIENLKIKPQKTIPIRWIHGKNDGIVSNTSYADVGYLGKLGLIPNWPGDEIYPQQCMINEIREILQLNKEQGFEVVEIELENCGHFPFLESEAFWELIF